MEKMHKDDQHAIIVIVCLLTVSILGLAMTIA